MYKNKLNKIWNLIKKIKNDINLSIILDFLDWFLIKLNIHFKEKINNKFPKQWEIWNIKLWINIWSEQNWEKKWWYVRPVLIIKIFWTKNDNIIILPLTKSKKPKYISYKLINTKYKFLKYYESYILLDQVKTISQKRLIWNPLWKISTDDLNKILIKFNNLFIINDKNRLKNIS